MQLIILLKIVNNLICNLLFIFIEIKNQSKTLVKGS